MKEQSLNNQADQIIAAHEKKVRRQKPTRLQIEDEAYQYNETFIKDRAEHGEQSEFDLTGYTQCNRHRQGLPFLGITVRQLDVLMRYLPGPLGLGMEVTMIARDMRCDRRTVQRVLSELRDKCPEDMEKVKSMRNVLVRQRYNLHEQMISLDSLDAAFYADENYEDCNLPGLEECNEVNRF